MVSKKSEIRAEMRKILSALDDRWVAAASRELGLNLTKLMESLSQDETKHILAWTSFFPGEADLSSFILRHIDSKHVYLPRAAPDKTMSFLEIDKNWTLSDSEDDLGIPAPNDKAGNFFKPEFGPQSLVLVPGLAFDNQGCRLGRGRGYYDRFFSLAGMAESVKVGICWQIQLLDQVPIAEHDINMDWVVTEEGIINTSFASKTNMKGAAR